MLLGKGSAGETNNIPLEVGVQAKVVCDPREELLARLTLDMVRECPSFSMLRVRGGNVGGYTGARMPGRAANSPGKRSP